MNDGNPGTTKQRRGRAHWTVILVVFFGILGVLQAGVAAFFWLAASGRIQPAALGITPVPLLVAGGAVFLGLAGFFSWMVSGLLRPSAKTPIRCLACGAKNWQADTVCSACGQPLAAYASARTRGSSYRIILRNDIFKVAAGLFVAALVLVVDYRIVSAGVPDEIAAYVRNSIGDGRDVRIAAYKALTVSSQQAARGVREAWCIELADPTRPSGYAPYIVYRDSALRTALSPVARCRGLDRW